MAVGERLLVASPFDTVLALAELLGEASFYQSVFKTCLRIALGFILSFFSGIVTAVLCFRFSLVKALLNPPIRILRAVPVASVVIVMLIWISSRQLSVATSFMMAFPIIHENVLKGLENTDRKLLEMAKVFRIGWKKTLRAIWLPGVLPYLEAASLMTLGLCWKAGVAAEIIGLPTGTIGEKLYQAKVFFDTPSVFAWTVVVIALSFVFEKLFAGLLKEVLSKWKA
jgi:ABC-type nitrate/sulfonate/bicarbonate transport system, permease component